MSDTSTLAAVITGLSSEEHSMRFVEGDGVQRCSYGELGQLVTSLARRWPGLGAGAGDRIVVVLPSKVHFVHAFLSATVAGLIPVPVFPPAFVAQADLAVRRLRGVCASCRPRFVVTSPELVAWCSAALGTAAVHTAVITVEQLHAAPDRGELPDLRPDDVAFLQYTSGSTSEPKGLAITHRNILANVQAIVRALDLGPTDVGVSWLPLYHDMGLIGFLLLPLLLETDVVHLDTSAFIRRPLLWLEWLSAVGGTVSYAPNFAYELLGRRLRSRQVESLDLRTWRVAGCGAEPVRPAVLRAFAAAVAAAGFDPASFTVSYGLAESTLLVTSEEPGKGLRTQWIDPVAAADRNAISFVAPGRQDGPAIEVANCGRPVDAEVRIDVDGVGFTTERDGAQGEVLVRSASVAQGYWGDANATADAFDGGWLRTGDLGFLRGGDLYLTGRIKDLVVRNGSKYHPHDMELAFANAVKLRPGQVMALSGPDEELVIALEARESSLSADEVYAGSQAVQSAVGLFPDRIIFVGRGGLPKTSSGKPRRAEMRRRLVDENVGVSVAMTSASGDE